MADKKISIVVPVFNEEKILETLHQKVAAACEGLLYEFEFLFVDDGSTDASLQRLVELSVKDPRVIALSLSRNFGQNPALSAGIDHASGDAVILMDADMEDEPGDLRKLIDGWQEGFEVVYAERGRRQSGIFRRMASALFHRINRVMEGHAPPAGTFSLMDRRVIDVLRRMPERSRYLPGLRMLAGFKQKGIVLDRGARYDRRPRMSIVRLFRLAIDSWVSHSKASLKLASMMGLLFSFCGFASIVFIVIYQLASGFKVSGWSSVMVTVIFASGIQLLCLGILGEYVAQILDETKQRPVYIVRSVVRGGRAEPPGSSGA